MSTSIASSMSSPEPSAPFLDSTEKEPLLGDTRLYEEEQQQLTEPNNVSSTVSLSTDESRPSQTADQTRGNGAMYPSLHDSSEDENHQHHQHQHQPTQQLQQHHMHQPINAELCVAPTVAISNVDEYHYGSDRGHTQRAVPWLTWRVVLAVISTLFCPICGVAAFVLAVMAEHRETAAAAADDGASRGSTRRMKQSSVVISALAIITTTTVVVACMSVWLFAEYGQSKLKCDNFSADGICYKYRTEYGTAMHASCNYGFPKDQFCYYDIRYPALSSDSTDVEKCDTVGADLDEEAQMCYYSSPAVCSRAANYANGICYVYRVPATDVDGGCSFGYMSGTNCYYDQRYLVNSDDDCILGWDTVGDDFCYSSSSTVCKYASNFVDGMCAMFSFSLDTSTCSNGIQSNGFCYYAYRKPLQGPFYSRTCDSGSDQYDGNDYCYYNKNSSDTHNV